MSPRWGKRRKTNWKPKLGGAGRVRTGDPLLAKQVLYQLSYGPIFGYAMMLYKEHALEIYFVRSIETQKTAGFPTASFDHRRDSR
jgi:hypothetical protein